MTILTLFPATLPDCHSEERSDEESAVRNMKSRFLAALEMTRERVSGKLILRFVVARLAAGFAVVKAIFAQPDAVLAHADVAVAVAFAAFFGHFALGAAEFGLGGVHEPNSNPGPGCGKVPLVT
jgi:hypothetical protein